MLRQVSPESESRPTMWPSTRTVTVCGAESGAWRTSNAMRSVSGLRKKAETRRVHDKKVEGFSVRGVSSKR